MSLGVLDPEDQQSCIRSVCCQLVERSPWQQVAATQQALCCFCTQALCPSQSLQLHPVTCHCCHHCCGQVIDVDAKRLQNVITFPPSGAFIVDSSIAVEGPQRVSFKFNAAKLKTASRDWGVPPFGQGW